MTEWALEVSASEKSSIKLDQISFFQQQFKEKYNQNLDAVKPRYALADLEVVEVVEEV